VYCDILAQAPENMGINATKTRWAVPTTIPKAEFVRSFVRFMINPTTAEPGQLPQQFFFIDILTVRAIPGP